MTNKKHRYLVACSGGPDSMALLDMYKDSYDLMVCHINYHKRDSADRDEKIVKNYCKKNSIPFKCFDYKTNSKGNFQDLAREFRYNCFKEVINANDLEGVLVGHHLDDLLETYFMQDEKNLTVSYYGLKRVTKLFDIKVVRPLLNYTKKDLEDYCLKHGIKYGIDESNLTDHYTRNKVRHSKIDKMTLSEKKEVLKEIKYKNYIQEEEKKIVNAFVKDKNKFDYDELMACPYIKRVLRKLIKETLSDKHLNEIIKALKSKNNVSLLIDNKYIFKEYGYIEIINKPSDYKVVINSLTFKKYDYFKLSKKGTSFEGVTVSEDDFPLTIRNVKEGDSIKMTYGTKKINRFFIDNKISSSKRLTWPIMLNRDGIAILVPKIGCNIDHYSKKHNLYMVKL